MNVLAWAAGYGAECLVLRADALHCALAYRLVCDCRCTRRSRSLQALFGVNYLAVIPEMKRLVVLSGPAVASTASCDLRGRTCYARKRLP